MGDSDLYLLYLAVPDGKREEVMTDIMITLGIAWAVMGLYAVIWLTISRRWRD